VRKDDAGRRTAIGTAAWALALSLQPGETPAAETVPVRERDG